MIWIMMIILQKNDIMIVPYTDVGWAPYFPLVSGVVTELGGLVSHGKSIIQLSCPQKGKTAQNSG